MSSNSWMSGIKPLIPKYKTETIKIPRPNLPSRTSSNNNLRNGGGQKVADACSSEVTVSRSAPVTEKKRKQKEISSSHSPRKDAVSKPRRSPSHQPLESDSDEEEETAIPAKKVRPEKLEPDFKRRLKNQKAYSTEAAESRESTRMIHAADVMMTKRRESRCESIRDRRNEEGDDVFLRYPSINRKERCPPNFCAIIHFNGQNKLINVINAGTSSSPKATSLILWKKSLSILTMKYMRLQKSSRASI